MSGVVVTADALHTQRAHARHLVEERGADYVLTVKENQPTLFAQLDALPWDTVPVHTTENTGHGRVERRTIRVLPAPEEIGFPHVAQVFLIERYVTDTASGKGSAVAALGVTSLAAAQRRSISRSWSARVSILCRVVMLSVAATRSGCGWGCSPVPSPPS
jgi:hypothetical protein